jgi:hypothetical protein
MKRLTGSYHIQPVKNLTLLTLWFYSIRIGFGGPATHLVLIEGIERTAIGEKCSNGSNLVTDLEGVGVELRDETGGQPSAII